MPVGRRRLLAVAGAIIAFAVTERGTRSAAEAAAKATTAMRPAADGTSTTRCALCGGRDHAMLDPRCPRARPGTDGDAAHSTGARA